MLDLSMVPRLSALLVASGYEFFQYERWLGQRCRDGGRDYLFSDPAVRFEPRSEDVVVAAPGLCVRHNGGAVVLTEAVSGAEVALLQVNRRDAERILGAIDGARCLAEVFWKSGVDADCFARFFRACFGLVVFAPGAVSSLEGAISGIEITRFPGAPYAIERAYWQNMADVREMLSLFEGNMNTPCGFLTALRQLHIVALMGATLQSYYKPASPVSDEVVAPGSLCLQRSVVLEGTEGCVFVHGNRVNVKLLGGEAYHMALARSVGDMDALLPQRGFAQIWPTANDTVLRWGEFVTCRSQRDAADGVWFCPPRPICHAHWEYMTTHYAAAVDRAMDAAVDGALSSAAYTARVSAMIEHLAAFHQAMVRVHPFHCANQSLAMNLVNAVLVKALGAGIPHLILDHFALRFSKEAYAKLFARAVRVYVANDTTASERLIRVIALKNACFRFIEACKSSGNELSEVIEQDPEGARAALVID